MQINKNQKAKLAILVLFLLGGVFGCYNLKPEEKHPMLARQGIKITYPDTWRKQAYYNAPSVDGSDAPVEARKNATFFNTVEIMDFLPGETKEAKIELDIEKLPRKMNLEQVYQEVISQKLKTYENKKGAALPSEREIKVLSE